MHWAGWVGIAVLCIIFAREQLPDLVARRRALKELRGREPLTPQEFARRYFPEDEVRAAIALRLLVILGKQLGLDISRVRPEDDLLSELGGSALDSLETVEVMMEIEDCFGLRLPEQNWERVCDFRSLVEFVAAQNPQGIKLN
ncbi:MAG: acyl carrier protein [Planctomycetes bacterium]|nr:acyl carrier protein [Planctomycetota bacterium]